MYTLVEWNWGLYRTQYSNIHDAEMAYVEARETARLNFHPEPYVEDSKGNKIKFDWEKNDEM